MSTHRPLPCLPGHHHDVAAVDWDALPTGSVGRWQPVIGASGPGLTTSIHGTEAAVDETKTEIYRMNSSLLESELL